MSAPFCHYCGKESKLTTGKEVHPFVEKTHDKKYYYCDGCGAYVGVHAGSDKPLGTLAHEELRKLRTKAHRLFDKHWENGRERKKMYNWLAKQMGIHPSQCHFAMFDELECKSAIYIIKNFLEN